MPGKIRRGLPNWIVNLLGVGIVWKAIGTPKRCEVRVLCYPKAKTSYVVPCSGGWEPISQRDSIHRGNNMNLSDPCRDCGTPNSYLCGTCSTYNLTDQPVCIHCCPHQNERQRNGWSCEVTDVVREVTDVVR